MSIEPTRRVAAALVLMGCAASCAAPPPNDRSQAPTPLPAPTLEVRAGIEVLLADSAHLIAGRRVGLITNRSGISREGASSIDLLDRHPAAELVALFAPEHGIRGTAAEGASIEDETDPETGLPVYSLYGETRSPSPALLGQIDVLAFDLQDIGSRYYTYMSTMAFAMRAAGEAGVPFIVLDRPNPIGGHAQGPVLDPAFSTFVGLYPVPARHGMTAGELARLYAGAFGIEVELHVVPVAGWSRDLWFDDTGLPWVAPSLNMPSLESAVHYAGTCLFEGTNLSVGRGTDMAFQILGAPWLDGAAWAERLSHYELAGVRIEAATFTPDAPSDGKFERQTVSGIRLTVTDRARYDPVITAVAALLVARGLAGERWVWNERHFDRLAGTDRLRIAIDRGDALEDITAGWEAGLAAFEELRRPYLLY